MIEQSYAIAGAVTGFLVGLTGVGGGSLMTPILLLVFGIAPHTAVATDLWFAVLTKMVAAGLHGRGGQIDWQVVRRLWAGSLPVAVVTVIYVTFGTKVQKIDWLAEAIGVVVMITAVGMIFSPKLLAIARNRRSGDPQKFKATQPALTVLAGALLGLLVALTSVGAGAIGTVMMLFLYPIRLTPHRLVATDIAHAIPLSFVAGLGYLFAGMVDGKMLLSLLAGSIPAVILGTLAAKWSHPRALQVALACVLLLVGLKTLL